MSSTLTNIQNGSSVATLDGLVNISTDSLTVNGNIITGNYLPLSGGVISGNLSINGLLQGYNANLFDPNSSIQGQFDTINTTLSTVPNLASANVFTNLNTFPSISSDWYGGTNPTNYSSWGSLNYGLKIGWNKSNGGGETCFFNSGQGGGGGFSWYNTNSSNQNLVLGMTLDSSANLTLNGTLTSPTITSLQTQINSINTSLSNVAYVNTSNTFTNTNSFVNISFSGTLNSIPSGTFGYLSGVTSSIQNQINNINTSSLLSTSNTWTNENRFNKKLSIHSANGGGQILESEFENLFFLNPLAYAQCRIMLSNSTSGYSTLFRQDGNQFLIMLTNQNDAKGNYNNLRPFYITNSTGEVHIETPFTFTSTINGFSTSVFSYIMNILTQNNTWTAVNAHNNYIQMSAGNSIYFNNPSNTQSMRIFSDGTNALQIANQGGSNVLTISQAGNMSLAGSFVQSNNLNFFYGTGAANFLNICNYSGAHYILTTGSALVLGYSCSDGNPVGTGTRCLTLNSSGLNVVGNTTINSTLTGGVGNTILTLNSSSGTRLIFTDEYGASSTGPGVYGNAGYGLTLGGAGQIKFFTSVSAPPTGYNGTPSATLSSSGLTLNSSPVNQALTYVMSSSGNGGTLSYQEFQFHQLYSLVGSIFPSTIFLNAFIKYQNTSSFMLFGDITYYTSSAGGYQTNFTFNNNTTGDTYTASQYHYFNLSSVHTSCPFSIEYSSANPNGLMTAGSYSLIISRTSLSQITDGNDRIRIMYKISNN
jgi:hypothetical protein